MTIYKEKVGDYILERYIYDKGGMKLTKKQKAHQKKFGKAVKKCNKKTKTRKQYASCMRKELKK